MLFSELLERRVRTDGARPLITWYGPADGSGPGARPRTELSAISFANWVSKTGNLLTGTLGLIGGDSVAMPLVRSHPEQWMTLVWVAACWRAGMCVEPDAIETAPVDVVGPELDVTDAADHLACSLHPLGLGFGLDRPLPPGVLDYATEVRSEPDAYLGPPADPQDAAWRDDERRLRQADLTAPEVSGAVAVADRILVAGLPPWPTVATALLGPLLGGGSAVLVSDPADDDLAAIAEAEHAVHRIR